MSRPSKLQPDVYQYALQVYEVISNPVSLHILRQLEQKRNLTAEDMSGEYKVGIIRKYIRRMVDIKLLRIDKMQCTNTYILNHDRLDDFTASAGSVLPKNPAHRR